MRPLTAPNKIAIAGLTVVMLVSGWIWWGVQNALQVPVVFGNPVLIEINRGDSFNQITDKLLAQNVAVKPFWFKAIAVLNRAVKKLKTGEYELAPGLTQPEILALFVQGKTKKYAITIPEGWNLRELLGDLGKSPAITHTIHSEAGTETAFLGRFCESGLEPCNPEGMFFPDTYFFEKHTTDIALLKRAYDKMQLVLQQEWQQKADFLPFKTPYEALIMASIVEKETGVAAERPMIAGVFVRRLQAGMLLQTDPTVIYGMGESYLGNISHKDLRTATAYNTYIIKGLPPTPIAMPGREAIKAVLHPDSGNALYFVARGDGTHVFSATLKDHNLAVDSFQRKSK
ncbi:MAG: endolytic transglycosylase MltG [Methylococcales bacterium]|nr:endolytic transglycosylase MltG [Methylococcales bacterium]